jgi:DNA-binding HxlR family transcriptional regulator
VRDLMFKNLHTFNEFPVAGEGIASNILTDRLAKLEAPGIVTTSAGEADARRFRYQLTEKGVTSLRRCLRLFSGPRDTRRLTPRRARFAPCEHIGTRSLQESADRAASKR